jgi:hypothetical protein
MMKTKKRKQNSEDCMLCLRPLPVEETEEKTKKLVLGKDLTWRWIPISEHLPPPKQNRAEGNKRVE